MNVQTIFIPFDEELLPAKKLTTGKISCLYEHGRLRYLKYGDIELIRMIYFAVRDKDWKTALCTIENESIETDENGFSISYNSFHKLYDISFRTDVLIQAVDNAISFYAKGEALSSFQRNRIGICVHHPVKECEGKKVIVTRPDGTDYTASFPDLISPYQPFKEIMKMQCEISEGIKTELNFEGDTFETEDQRNWSDSSFKTYSTPLNIHFPVQVNKGDLVEQKLEIKITGENVKKEAETITKEEKRIPFPKIGYEFRSGEQLSGDEINLLLQIHFDHYRVELSLFHTDWQHNLQKNFEETKKIKTKLELVLFINDDFKNQLSLFLIFIEENAYLIGSILVLHTQYNTTPKNILEFAYTEIKSSNPHIKVGYGTNRFFADLNRNRPAGNKYDFVSFSLCPQVHADDSRSLIENLERQADIIQTVLSFTRGKQIHISPVTLKTRVIETEINEVTSDYDSRQHRSFGAFWTLSAIKNLGEADRLTFYQVKGYRGILNDKNWSEESPLYQSLKKLKEFKPKWIIRDDNEKSSFHNITLENEEGNRLEFVLQKSSIVL